MMPQRITWLAIVALLPLLGGGCARPFVFSVVHHAAKGTPTVVILKSGTNPLYELPAQVFRARFEDHATIYETTLPESPHKLALAMRRLRPDLIFALGAPAASFATQAAPTTPLLYAMVVNPQEDILSHTGTMGISFAVAPQVQFSQFKMILPEMRRVLVVYAPEQSQQVIDATAASIQPLDITLVPVATETRALPADIKNRIAAADAVWLLNDPIVATKDNFVRLRALTASLHKPFITSVSDAYVHSGALMSVSIDFRNLGSQAAAMAEQFFGGDTPETIGIQDPIGGKLVLNADVAKQLGLQIPTDIVPFINEIVQGEAQAANVP